MPASPVSDGLAKIHFFNAHPGKNGFGFKTLAVEAEEAGLVPTRTFGERIQILGTPEGSIEYLGAIMNAISTSVTDAGFPDIRRDAAVLTNVYQGHTLASWKKHLQSKPAGTRFKPGNPMGLWVEKHALFLEEAIGPGEALEATIQLTTPADAPRAPGKPTAEPEQPPTGLDFLDPGSDIGVLP